MDYKIIFRNLQNYVKELIYMNCSLCDELEILKSKVRKGEKEKECLLVYLFKKNPNLRDWVVSGELIAMKKKIKKVIKPKATKSKSNKPVLLKYIPKDDNKKGKLKLKKSQLQSDIAIKSSQSPLSFIVNSSNSDSHFSSFFNYSSSLHTFSESSNFIKSFQTTNLNSKNFTIPNKTRKKKTKEKQNFNHDFNINYESKKSIASTNFKQKKNNTGIYKLNCVFELGSNKKKKDLDEEGEEEICVDIEDDMNNTRSYLANHKNEFDESKNKTKNEVDEIDGDIYDGNDIDVENYKFSQNLF